MTKTNDIVSNFFTVYVFSIVWFVATTIIKIRYKTIADLLPQVNKEIRHVLNCNLSRHPFTTIFLEIDIPLFTKAFRMVKNYVLPCVVSHP